MSSRRIQPIVRHCSFCGLGGHRITNCFDPRLYEFERTLVTFIINNNITINSINSNGFNIFKNFLLERALETPNLVKAFAIKKCGSNMRQNIDTCIEHIIVYFMERQYHDNEINQRTSSEDQNQLNALRILSSQPGFMESIRSLINLNREQQLRTEQLILDYILFIDTILQLNQINQNEEVLNRKFNIQTKISDKQENFDEICECVICYESYEKQNFVKLNCDHEFCKDCIIKSLQNERKLVVNCAYCRSEIKIFEIRNSSIREDLCEFIES